MKSNILKLSIIGFGFLMASTVTAQDVQKKEGKKKVPKFVRMDTNKDAKISLVEYNKHRAEMREKKGKEAKKGDFSKRFKEIDINKDGFLSKDEFKNRKETKKAKK